MSIKQKIIILLCTCFLGIFAINVGIQRYIIYPGFVALEKENIDKNMERIREGIFTSADELSTLVRDWAHWGDSYQFINDGNQDFIDSSLTGALDSVAFGYIGYFNLQGRCIYSDHINDVDFISLEQKLPDLFVKLNYQTSPQNEREVRTILLIKGVPIFVSISFVFNSAGTGKSNGYLVMAKLLDAEIIKEISVQIQVPFVFDNTSSFVKDAVINIDENTSELFVCLAPDEFQIPLVFKSLYKREIEQKGSHSIYISFIVITFALLILFVVFYLFFSRFLLLPIINLTQAAEQICKENTYTIRIDNDQKDEIGHMAIAFNTMIETVEKSMANEMVKRQEADEKSIALEESIAELHIAQKQLIETEKQASLGSLVSGIAHEINTPLGVCVSYTSFLHDQYLAFINDYKQGVFKKSNFDKFCNNIDESLEETSENLKRIAGLVKSFKQISATHSSYRKQSFELCEFTKNVCKLWHDRRDLKQYNCVVEGYKNILMHSSPVAINFIFDKLIENSLLHGFTTLEEGTIAISLEQEGDNVVIRYRDDGNGMTPEAVEQVFDPFFTTNKGSGPGLGSHIIYNVVTQTLLGEIDCASTLGLGVIFTITLPCNIED